MALLLFATFRLLTLLLLRPGGFIRDWSDFDTYLGIASLSDYGLYPYLHFWLEWPPIIPWLMVGAYKLSLLLPLWEDPRFWFTTILGTVFVLFEVGNFILLYRLARRLLPDPTQVSRVLWLYAGLFPPVYAMLGFFDGAALFFILFSLNLILQDKMRLSAVTAALGFAVKLTPILIAGTAAKYLLHKYRPDWRKIFGAWLVYGLIFAGTALLLLLPFLLTHPEWLLTSVKATLGRSSWETLWAVWEGYYGFGKVLGDRLNPAESAFAVHPASLPWGLISLAFAALYLTLFFRPANFSRPRPVIAFTGLTITLFLLYSKGYSPQFLVYVLPFIILLMPNLSGLGYALLLTLLNVLEQPVYFVILPNEHWLLTAVVVARFALLIALSIEFAAQVGFGFQVSGFRFGVWGLRLRAALFAVILLGALLAVPKGLQAYRKTQLSRSPHRDLIGFLETQAETPSTLLLLTEHPLYRQLRPWLRDDYRLKLAGGDALYAGAPSLEQLTAGEGRVWLLAAGAQGESVRQAMNARGTPLLAYQIEDVGTLNFYDFTGAGKAPQPIARAKNGVELLAKQLEPLTDTLRLTLYWQAPAPLENDYTVFTQILGADGQFIAGHDAPPANGARPTTGWTPGELIPDTHRIPLPADWENSEYTIIVGMYDASGARLPFSRPDGTLFENGAIGE